MVAIRMPVAAFLWGMAAVGALADDARETLARQIEAEAETTRRIGEDSDNPNTYPVLTMRKRMTVVACEITIENTVTAERDSGEVFQEQSDGLTFDLGRTRLPEPDPVGEEGAIVVYLGNGEHLAIIRFDFVPPYRPTHVSSNKFMQTGPVTAYAFAMEPLADPEHPQRLLGLLRRYQSDYCSFTG